MSWIFGAIGQEISRERRESLRAHTAGALHTIDRPGLMISAGGFERTCCAGSIESRRGGPEGYVVVGVGIGAATGDRYIFESADWAPVMAAPRPDFRSVDGHYVALRYDERGVDLFCDELGMRTCYVARLGDCTVFSTRLDWIARATGRWQPDLIAFGAHWLAYNQFVCDSLVAGIDRLGPGARARLTAHELDAREMPWTPDPGRAIGGDTEMVDLLASIVAPHVAGGLRPSLGLSGGLDSRFLLSVLAARHPGEFVVHTFGPSADPDVAVARELTASLGLPLMWIDEPLPPSERLLELLVGYAAGSNVVEPASSVAKLRHYPVLDASGRVSIDGGMGEILRRQFCNRLALRGRGAVARRDVGTMARHLSQRRADVFTPEARERMVAGLLQQLDRVVGELPDGTADEQLVDLLVVRSRYPNMAGYEQARADEGVLGMMPFAQASLLHAAFSVPLEERRNARMVRRIIALLTPRLREVALVKSGVRYPWRLSTVPAWAYAKVRTRIAGRYVDPARSRMLDSLEPFVRELVSSGGVRDNPIYDLRAIDALVTRYYQSADPDAAAELDWFIALELWFRALRGGRPAD